MGSKIYRHNLLLYFIVGLLCLMVAEYNHKPTQFTKLDLPNEEWIGGQHLFGNFLFFAIMGLRMELGMGLGKGLGIRLGMGLGIGLWVANGWG